MDWFDCPAGLAGFGWAGVVRIMGWFDCLAGLAGSADRVLYFFCSFFLFLFSLIIFDFELQFKPNKFPNLCQDVLCHHILLGTVFSQDTSKVMFSM